MVKAVKAVTKSSMSFKGWNFMAWFLGNASTIKEILKVGLPLLIGIVTTHSELWAGFITLVGKFLLDAIEYWAKPR
jgi:hypothetical protein